MKMEAITSCSAYCDSDRRDLESLLEAFGSVFSLKDIASAYCQASQDVHMAGEILSTLQGSTSSTDTYSFKDGLEVANAASLELSSEWEGASSTSSELSSDNVLQKSNQAERNSRVSKPKKCSVSMGTVSGVIGKEYVRPRPLTNETCKATKPLKLDSRELAISEIWIEKVPLSSTSRNDTIHKDVEEFLFQMLGDGFQLDMNVIREVLGHCGYDLKKSMEKLLDLSVSNLEISDDVVGIFSGKSTGKCPDMESPSCQEKLQMVDSTQSDGRGFINRNEIEPPKRKKDRYDLQKEVLLALFSAPERSEEKPRRINPMREVKRSGAYGKVVVEPLRDTTSERRTVTVETQVTEDDEEDSYEVLRKAVKEYWITMKEYYKAAIEAFAKGDHARAYKLLEQGQFFNRKAREVDEKSMQNLFKTRDEDVSLDLRVHKPIEALRLLRLHLSSLSGIPSIQYLKVIVGTNDEDTKGARKRRITVELEKESIKWTEEGNGGTILIRVDEINPKRLSFAK